MIGSYHFIKSTNEVKAS